MRFVLAALLTLAGLAGLFVRSSNAAEAVGGVQVIDRPTTNGLELLVENRNLAAVTLTIRVDGRNAVLDKTNPVVVSCRGQGTFAFAKLRPLRPTEAFGYDAQFDWQFGQAVAKHATGIVYELPLAPGVASSLMQGYHGEFTHTGNNAYAVDFAMPEGTPVHAAREGTVEVVVDRFEAGGLDPIFRDRVNMILIRHPDGTYAEYVHLQAKGARAKVGQKVRARELIGLSGNTGYTQGPHLHFAVFRTLDGEARETFPVRFRVAGNFVVEPREGLTYTAP